MSEIKAQFHKRATEYNSYTKWLNDPELFRLCTLPLNDYVKNAQCLDIGGGTGWLAFEDYKQSGREWTVLDISEDMGKIVPEPVKFICGNAEEIPLPDESFDFIIVRSVFRVY
ncbi:MAG: class I SAM-dependent methyltransferase [Saprospiraceae bacterium]|nr:class I SAM-dependent methyltransferase [Saprospiraceae bacterium]